MAQAQFVREVVGEQNTTYYIAPFSEKSMNQLRNAAYEAKAKPKLYTSAFADRGEGRTNKLVEAIVLVIMNEKKEAFAETLSELSGGDFTTDKEVKRERKSRREDDTGSEWLNNALGRNKGKANEG